MTRPIDPTEVLCKDGRIFSVDRKGGRVTVYASFRDRIAVDAGLAKFTTFHEPGDACAEHAGMPVEIVREYARLHGGVAQAGEQALALLKELAGEADAPTAPPPRTRPALFTDSPASPGKPELPIDDLTTAVIDARRAVDEITGPVTWRWGKRPSDKLEAVATHERRISRGRGLASRLVIVGHAQYARHPLLVEAIRLREQLDIAAANSLAALEDMRAEDLARAQAANGIRPPDEA